MPQADQRTRRKIAAALILIAALCGVLRRASFRRAPRLVFAAAPAQQEHHPFPTNPSFPAPPTTPETPVPMTPKQKEKLMKFNFKKTQRDADQLFKLAQSLKENLDKSNSNILSVKVVHQAGQIEKLAKKIKGEALSN
ncbi:MAG TPA: hypothetical protein VMX16_13835 [Terriglobia bacterium]|nr:hypothetical protein [Terriglobia bacterium]